ncbi:MAG: hypothetical protein ACRC11_11680 [Xenococcaceae cyanobacterium]
MLLATCYLLLVKFSRFCLPKILFNLLTYLRNVRNNSCFGVPIRVDAPAARITEAIAFWLEDSIS